MNLLSKIVISSALVLFTLITFADMPIDYNLFKDECVAAPDGKENKYNDKLCECIADQLKEKLPGKKILSLEGLLRFQKIIEDCLAQTYLTSVMDRVKDEKSLTVDKILSACAEENKTISADQMPDKELCSCSADKIIALDKEQQRDPDTLKNIYRECAKQLQN